MGAWDVPGLLRGEVKGGGDRASGRTLLVCPMTYVLGQAGGQAVAFTPSFAYEVATMTISPSATTITSTLMTALSIWSEPCPGLGSGHADHLTETCCAHGADVLMGAERR